MATSARKKSVNSSSGLLNGATDSVAGHPTLHIDTPVAMNTALNKQAGTSLYQQCLALRNRLLKIHDFAAYFALIDRHEELANLDVVHRLWHTLALGIPLCFLYNLLDLPVADRLILNTDPEDIDIYEADPDAALKAKKKAAAFFIMGVQRLKNNGMWDTDVELFTVTELTNLDKKDTNGFVKVVATTSHLLDKLPEHVWMPEAESPPISARDEANNGLRSALGDDSGDNTIRPGNVPETGGNNVIRELVETERKYIQDLEVMHNYAQTLMTQGIVDHDTVHHLFPGLNKLLDFQRKFSIELEQQYEQPWEQQRWGRCFSINEANFAVYEPYCANYTTAVELVIAEEPHLMQLAHLINPKSELQAFLIKPVQRICKYPLFFEQMLKKYPTTNEYYSELVEGAASCKRIADKVNEAQRRAENVATVKLLEKRVEDWKGHALSNFGDLVLDEVFNVTKSDVDREYHVFLFEKIILCCKDATVQNGTSKKVGKSNSILKKQSTSGPASPGGLLAGGAAAAKKKTTPLLLKGRIFLNNVTEARPNSRLGPYALQVWWKGDDDLEYFTLRCRTEEQVKQWEVALTKLINDVQTKRNEKHAQANNGHPYNGGHERALSSAASSVSTLPPYTQSANPAQQQRRTYAGGAYPEEKNHYGAYNGGSYYGQQPYSAPNANQGGEWKDGFDDREEREDEFDEDRGSYGAPAYSIPGRGTPIGAANGRRGAVGVSMPPERDTVPGYDRPRARTEDAATFARWQQQQHGLPPTPSSQRPPLGSRQTSVASGASMSTIQSEASFGNGLPQQRTLRSQFSSGRLRGQYDDRGYEDEGQLRHGQPATTPRTRAVSNPSSAYTHQQSRAAPPVPIAPQWTGSSQSSGSGVDRARIAAGASQDRIAGTRNQSSLGSRRPLSGGSSDTGESSEHSPESGPGMHSSSTSGGTLRGTRSQVFNGHSRASGHNPAYSQNGAYPPHGSAGYGGPTDEVGPPVKIKVYWLDDLFVIMVPRTTGYSELMQRVQKKIRLCGGGNTDGPLRLRYDDEDGDRISLSTDEELQMAFDMTLGRMNGQLTLRVS